MRSDVTGRDSGETLAEVLVAVMILGIAVVALMGGLGASAVGSDNHRARASAEVALRGHAEAIRAAVFQPNCALAQSTSYTAATLGIATQYPGYVPSLSVAAHPSWTCATSQLVTLTVTTPRAVVTTTIAKEAS